MVFKRRNKRSYGQIVSEGLYPRGGWRRAASYVMHRLWRLPDPPYRIARGIAAGVFICFTPFFGLHIVLAMALAFVMRGNIMAAAIATFFGNPITFPIIATVAVELGSWMLGLPGGMQLASIMAAFSSASAEIWFNFSAMFTSQVAEWDRLGEFFRQVFLPYLVGGIVPGVIGAVAAYTASHMAITAYQNNRISRLKRRFQKRRNA
ncbi:MAG: DUF2062 domain-containing protein [Paracoccaceae bacterium]